MFYRRVLVLVYLALYSTTILASTFDATSLEARVVKAKARPVAKPPVAKPPVAKPPVAKPPVAKPPVAKPPVAKPPVAKPPVAQPPVAKPPVAQPPVAKPPVAKPPATPPVANPPVAKPPVANPPVAKPPVANPPVSKPPTKPVSQAPVKPSASKKPTKSASSAAPSASASGLACVKPTTPSKVARKVGDKVPDQFIVHLKAGTKHAAHITKVNSLIAQAAKCDRIKSKVTLDNAAVQKLSFYGGIFGPSVVAALKKLPEVKSVVANTLVEVDSPIPVRASMGNGTVEMEKRALLFDTTQTNSWSLARLNTGTRTVTDAIAQEDFSTAATARNRNTRNWPFKNIRNAGRNVNVYIIDTGVSDHSDLTGRIVRKRGANVATGAANIDDTTDNQGHGTKMAGIIAGQTCGVAKFANIIPVKAGNNAAITQMDIIAGLAFAVSDANGAGGVINISARMQKNQNDGLPEMVASVIAQGMHVVNSAGNGGTDQCATRIGTNDGPITVGNVGIDDQKAFTSNFGACLTVFAPGNDIQTTAHNNPANFISGSGTSEATAHTSGLVATLLSDKTLTPAAMKAKVVQLAAVVPTIQAPDSTNRLIQVPRPLI
ncbi:peptidase S8/S53 domain-containing protein [Mycena crocata]|nr:peptidase S8/S53 domain-containing protein [Mycena crocata]